MGKSDHQGHLHSDFSKLEMKKWPPPEIDNPLRNTTQLPYEVFGKGSNTFNFSNKA